MRIAITTVALLFSVIAGAQKGWFWANLNKSPRLTIVTTNTQNGDGSRTHSLTSVPAGAFLVVSTQSEDASGNASMSSSPSLTWTKRADAQATSSGNAEIWTATFTAGGTITITSNFGGNKQSSVAWVITGAETTFGGATATSVSLSPPTRSITTTRANSILICVSSDWNAVDGSGRAYVDSPTEVHYYHVSGAATGYHYYKQVTATGSYTEGLSLPATGQSAGTAVIEVRIP